MNNYILLSNRKRKHDALHFVGKSVLNGTFVYEILLDKINKNETLIKQLKCRLKNIVVNHDVCNLHVSVLQMKNTINIYDPYNYKNI
jgi:hypothetical protein